LLALAHRRIVEVIDGRLPLPFEKSGGPRRCWCTPAAFGHHEGRTPTHGYAATREAAMAAFAKSWRRE
jgi:hypothetical protein